MGPCLGVLFIFAYVSVVHDNGNAGIYDPISRFYRPKFNFLMYLLPLNILRPVTSANFVCVNCVHARCFVLAIRLIRLVTRLTIALLRAMRRSIHSAILRAIRLILMNNVRRIGIPIDLSYRFFLVRFLSVFTLALRFPSFLPLHLFNDCACKRSAFRVEL